MMSNKPPNDDDGGDDKLLYPFSDDECDDITEEDGTEEAPHDPPMNCKYSMCSFLYTLKHRLFKTVLIFPPLLVKI